MSALIRVLRAPGLVATVFVGQALVAFVFGSGMGSAVSSAMGSNSLAPDRNPVAAAMELIGTNASLKTLFSHTASGSALFAVIFWTLLAPAILLRLRAKRPLPRLAGDAARTLPGVVGATVWNLLIRLIPLAILAAVTGKLANEGAWGLVALAALLAFMAYATCAGDLARARVALAGARGWRPKTAWRGYLEAARRPKISVRSLFAYVLNLACVASALAFGVAEAGGDASVWIVRALALVGTVFALTRIAVAVEAVERY